MTVEHRIRWYVYAGGYGQPLEKLRHTANMRGHWPGWDADCTCGWSAATGGAVKSYVQTQVDDHKWDAGIHPLQRRYPVTESPADVSTQAVP